MLEYSIKSLIFTFATLATITHADPNAQSKFESHLRAYFADFAGGRDVIDDIQYTHAVAADYTRASRPDRPSDGQDIEYELAYVRVFKRILCRVGIGYSAISRFEFDVDPAVFAECVPMTQGQFERISLADVLPTQFEEAKRVLLGTQPSLWRDIASPRIHPDTVAWAYEGRPAALVAARLYWLESGSSRRNRVQRVKAVHVGEIKTTYDNGNTRTESVTGDLWEVDFAALGAELVGKKDSSSSPEVDRSCERTFLGRLLDWVPGPMF